MNESGSPRFALFNASYLLERKKLSDTPKEILAFLKEAADKQLSSPHFSVTDRKIKAPSGNPQDYASIGPYWWPNPDTKDHLPYVKRDGYFNPDSKDQISISNLSSRLQTLALAEFYFGGGEYAKCAERQLYVWFLDEKLKMNPHARYAQAVPGKCEGRGIGIIDFHPNIELLDAVMLLEWMCAISDGVASGVKEWYSAFTDWLLSSEIGISADNQPNNHGSWFDAHVLALSLYLGRENLTARVLRTSYEQRQLRQYKENGEQPMELRRESAITYSCFNLSASLIIAKIAKECGDLRYTESGVLEKAADYIASFKGRMNEFPYSEIHAETAFHLLPFCYRLLDRIYPDKNYAEKSEKHTESFGLWQLYL